MKRNFCLLLITVLLALCSQDVSAQECSMFLRFNGMTSLQEIPAKSVETKANELVAINVRAKEIRRSNRNKLFAGIAAGVAVAGTAVAAGVAAGKKQAAENEAANQARIANDQAEQQRIRANYQQSMAARGVDVTKTETQKIAESSGAYQFAQINQTGTTQQNNVVSANGSDAYGQRGASVGASTSAVQYGQSEEASEQVVTGCAIVNGSNVPVQLKVSYSSSKVVVTAIKLNTSKLSGTVDMNWRSIYQIAGVNQTTYMDGSYAKDYKYSFVYEMGINEHVTIYFN